MIPTDWICIYYRNRHQGSVKLHINLGRPETTTDKSGKTLKPSLHTFIPTVSKSWQAVTPNFLFLCFENNN